MLRALKVTIAAIAGTALSACTASSPQPSVDADSTFIPAGVQAFPGVVLVTGESVPAESDELNTGVGVGGQIKLGPEGCLSIGMDEGARSSRLLVFPAGSRLESQDGETVVRVGDETFAIGDAFEGGRSINSPDGRLKDVYPQVATDVPEPCRKMPVFTVEAPVTHPAPRGVQS